MRQLKSHKRADELLRKHNLPGMKWTIRHERVVCACNTGDSGMRDTYNNGKQDIIAVEYPCARYTSKVFSLVEGD